MIMKKLGNLLFQLELTGGITHRGSVLKKAPLDFGWKFIPLHDHRSPETSQDTFFVFWERNICLQRKLRSSALIVPPAYSLG